MAQVELFFPLAHPVSVTRKQARRVELKPRWPEVPLEELGYYGTVKPGGGGKLHNE